MEQTKEKKIANFLIQMHEDLNKLSLSELRRLESHFNGVTPEMEGIRQLIRLYSEPVFPKRYKAVRPDDSAKIDLELVCTDCEEAICDIEDDDSMDVLVCMMVGHDREKHR